MTPQEAARLHEELSPLLGPVYAFNRALRKFRAAEAALDALSEPAEGDSPKAWEGHEEAKARRTTTRDAAEDSLRFASRAAAHALGRDLTRQESVDGVGQSCRVGVPGAPLLPAHVKPECRARLFTAPAPTIPASAPTAVSPPPPDCSTASDKKGPTP